MELTAAELEAYDGSDKGKPIYVAVKGTVYDVTAGKGCYGPDNAHCMFAGKDAIRALRKMSKSEEDVQGDLVGLTEKEIGVLDEWEKKFQAKYPVVSRVV